MSIGKKVKETVSDDILNHRTDYEKPCRVVDLSVSLAMTDNNDDRVMLTS